MRKELDDEFDPGGEPRTRARTQHDHRNEFARCQTSERLDTPRKELQGLHVPEPMDGDLGYELALGSDGSFFVSLQFDGLDDFAKISRRRRLFVGVAREQHSSVAAALREFGKRLGPMAVAFNGNLYLPCHTRDEIMQAQNSGLPMFYGYSATARETLAIQQHLMSSTGEFYLRLPLRPGRQRKKKKMRVALH